MSWISLIHQLAADRANLASIDHRVEELEADLNNIAESRKPDDVIDYLNCKNRILFEIHLCLDEKAEIETRKTLNMAARWKIPVPPKPHDQWGEDENGIWRWSSNFTDYYLTETGHFALRREVYNEIDMRFKPIVSWTTLVVAVLGLVIAI
ncbi:hypothetical protein [Rhizobium sp. TRM95796]|uniref:hypothetical protein n=1 Tax=Rhizobium sp. TRM95796 TaxID=2979862 RepID=UPI0021E96E16|nr:hypothetical protein [Rhizobium sp. TRM95796]MCV3766558.1 hypothetical protein [Rhizobium sp. TRM95796]